MLYTTKARIHLIFKDQRLALAYLSHVAFSSHVIGNPLFSFQKKRQQFIQDISEHYCIVVSWLKMGKPYENSFHMSLGDIKNIFFKTRQGGEIFGLLHLNSVDSIIVMVSCGAVLIQLSLVSTQWSPLETAKQVANSSSSKPFAVLHRSKTDELGQVCSLFSGKEIGRGWTWEQWSSAQASIAMIMGTLKTLSLFRFPYNKDQG